VIDTAPLDPGTRPVLVVMIDHHLGNTVLSLPVIERLAAYFEHPVHVLVDARYAELVALLPSVSHIVTYPQQSTKRRNLASNTRPLLLAAGLPFKRYRALFNLCYGTRAWTLAATSLARHRLGLGDDRRRWVYTRTAPRLPEAQPHWYDRYVTMLGFIGERGRPPWVTLRAPDDAHARLDARLKAKLPDPDAPLLVVHPSAGKPGRRWPAAKFAAVADALVRERGMQVCIIGTPSERPLLEEVQHAMDHAGVACCLSLPLLPLLALFERAALLVSNESGPTHLASTTTVPIATIFGPSREHEWGPVRGDDLLMVRSRACDPGCPEACGMAPKCIEAMTVEMVLDAARKVLGGNAAASTPEPPLAAPRRP
jgi:ADP-heptose:LPS heptosyltransferase